MTPTVLWFRQDLRLADNPALAAALRRGGPLIPVYILDEAGEGRWPYGGASRWWLHHSLISLRESLRAAGSDLLVRRGDLQFVLEQLMEQSGAGALYWNRRYEPAIIRRDQKIKSEFRSRGWEVESFNSALLFEPHTIQNREGGPFKVFTPFWRQALTFPIAAPAPRPRGEWPAPHVWPERGEIESLELLPSIRWDAGLDAAWHPGEAAAQKRLQSFVSRASEDYESDRDQLAIGGSSRLSAALRFGEIGPRQIWSALQRLSRDSGVFPANRGVQKYLTELGWREFAYHQLYHFPDTPEKPLRAAFEHFPWAADPGKRKLRAWERGRTGYPVVDAAMRQLWSEGWMPNRARMIVGSFLVKHLRLPWQHGAAWFWDTLVDADLANNTLGWQWIAGCGADAAPYFRIFAPVLQSEKFDADGDYIRSWVPQLKGLPSSFIHAPWEAPEEVLARAGVRLGENYPRPIVDHAVARAEALAAFKKIG